MTAGGDPHPLFEAFPALAGAVHRVELGSFPTRVERLTTLGRRLGIGSLWIKRDDESGALLGGNKVRPLEYLLGPTIARKDHAVIGYGPLSSNWTLALAVYARQLGIPCHLVLFERRGIRVDEAAVALQREAAASVSVLSSAVFLLPELAALVYRGLPRGRNRIMPPGGTSPRSVLGFVNAWFELQRQVGEGRLPAPDLVVLPLGTGGSAAGLAAGVLLSGASCRVVGVRVTPRYLSHPILSRALANAALRNLGNLAGLESAGRVTAGHLAVEHGFYGGGYGMATREGREAARSLLAHTQHRAARSHPPAARPFLNRPAVRSMFIPVSGPDLAAPFRRTARRRMHRNP
jgi:D-cysteine desulfhydrase